MASMPESGVIKAIYLDISFEEARYLHQEEKEELLKKAEEVGKHPPTDLKGKAIEHISGERVKDPLRVSARFEMDGTRDVMIRNIDRIMERGERIETLLVTTEEHSSNYKAFKSRNPPKSRCKLVALAIMIIVGLLLLTGAVLGGIGLFARAHNLPNWLSHAIGTIGHSGSWPFWIMMIGGGIMGIGMTSGGIACFAIHRKKQGITKH